MLIEMKGILLQRIIFTWIIIFETTAMASNLTLYDFKSKISKQFYINNLDNVSNKYFDQDCETLSVLRLKNGNINGSKYTDLPSYGDVVSEYMGVKEKANEKDCSGIYQCTEYVWRFYKKIFNISKQHGNGKDIARNYGNKIGQYNGSKIKTVFFPVKYSYCNDKNRICYYDKISNNIFEKHPPLPGTILSFAPSASNGGYGHTAIVKYYKRISNNQYEIYIIEQNYIYKNQKGKYLISINRKFIFTKINNIWTIKGDRTPITGWTIPFYIHKAKCITRENIAKLFLIIFKNKLKDTDPTVLNKLNLIKIKLKQKIESQNITQEMFYNKYPKFKWVWNWVMEDQWTPEGIVLKFNGIWNGYKNDMLKKAIVTDTVFSIMLINLKNHIKKGLKNETK